VPEQQNELKYFQDNALHRIRSSKDDAVCQFDSELANPLAEVGMATRGQVKRRSTEPSRRATSKKQAHWV
jgi:hypothetical protein